jgi:hypothetical protein
MPEVPLALSRRGTFRALSFGEEVSAVLVSPDRCPVFQGVLIYIKGLCGGAHIQEAAVWPDD